MNQVILANELDRPDALATGQSLVIPEWNKEYVIQPGDTLWAIAARFGVTVADLVQTNQIADPSVIFVGQMLKFPYLSHTVVPGETLWMIAQRYSISVQDILQANPIPNPALVYPGQVLRVPAPARPTIDVNAYTVNMDEAARQEVLRLSPYLTYLTPFMYSIRQDGGLTTLNDAALNNAAIAGRVAPLLVLTNFADGIFDSEITAAVLRNPQLQETLITNLLNTMESKNYTGVNFDLEYIYPEDRENYNAFLRRTVARLRPAGYTVSTAVAPKVNADQGGLLYAAHDYEAHGQIVDFVIVMTYEWGWAGGEPWAVAPITEVRRVLDYAVTAIPPNKIMMGIPLYGRDWNIPWEEETFAATISPADAVRLAVRYGANIQYDEQYQAPFFRYTDESGQQHEVWFEDARSIQSKFDTAKEYGLMGVSYWVLGNPFPQNWHVQQNNFMVRKR